MTESPFQLTRCDGEASPQIRDCQVTVRAANLLHSSFDERAGSRGFRQQSQERLLKAVEVFTTRRLLKPARKRCAERRKGNSLIADFAHIQPQQGVQSAGLETDADEVDVAGRLNEDESGDLPDEHHAWMPLALAVCVDLYKRGRTVDDEFATAVWDDSLGFTHRRFGWVPQNPQASYEAGEFGNRRNLTIEHNIILRKAGFDSKFGRIENAGLLEQNAISS